MLGAKIHRATVTQADLHYEGSVTIDRTLLEASGILTHEQVHVWNVTRGTRFTTYALEGDRDSGIICINGAAAHLAGVNDLVIITTFVTLSDEEARTHQPRVILVDAKNRIKGTGPEIAGPALRESKPEA
jgi:aspartate 1-decarboxylase